MSIAATNKGIPPASGDGQTEFPAIMGKKERFQVLDGWRGISILLVLATHLLPLGPKIWRLNSSAGPLGMSLFFALSGFLITKNLLDHGDIRTFFIRRIFRILPLAYLYLAVVFCFFLANDKSILSHFSFTVNYLYSHFLPETLHFWSLCVEIHFYIFIGLWFFFFGKRGLGFLPLLFLLATYLTLTTHEHGGVKTHLRVHEILAGGVLALILWDRKYEYLRRFIVSIPFCLLILFLMVTSYASLTTYEWMRSYAAMLLVGHSLLVETPLVSRVLKSRFLAYIAEISFALYVIHPITIVGWLGSGEGLEKYIKRPLSLGLSFGLAHVSTHYFEKYFIRFGKKLAERTQTSVVGEITRKNFEEVV